jgi:tetratricopeptide (TPR) repeat protein
MHGYIELGMHEEATEELEKITPGVRHRPEVLLARVLIYQKTERWAAMAAVAAQLVDSAPENPGHFSALAYATRRADSIDRAREILLRAVALHPADAEVQFNLARYEAQLGNLPLARSYLAVAFRVEPELRASALADPDLKPLWAELGRTS